MKRINCILLIDDNPADNEFHKIKIKKADVCNHIKIATDGTKALDYILKSGEPNQSEEYPKPDLIYLDINMPGMNGFEFLEKYHNLDEKLKSTIVIIMLSTTLNPRDHKMAEENKYIVGFQNKPLTIESLLEIQQKHFK